MKRIIFIVTTLFFTTISSQAQSSFNITTSSTASCQDNGTLTVNFNNGTAPYYLTVYGPSGILFDSDVQTSSYTLNNLRNGTYSIYSNDIISYAPMKTIVVSGSYNISTIISSESCEGNGGINITPTGGQAPYSYLWDNGATTQNINNSTNNRYTVKVTDNRGCIFYSDSLIIPQNPAYDITFSRIDKSCTSKGSLTAIPSAGTAPYTYLWDTSPVQSSATASGLDEGMYTVRITDNTGCSQTQSSFVINTTNFNLNSITTNADCEQANGMIALNPSGGQAPYSYLWNNGETTSTITGLSGNHIYNVTVTDNTNCTSNINYFYIRKNSPLQATTTSADANCSASGGGGGSISAIVSNGTQPYTYVWNSGATTSSLSNISAGWYSVIIKDANNCSAYTYERVKEPALCFVNISGKVFNDLNGNCLQDIGESAFPYCSIKYGLNKYTYSDQYGNYSFQDTPNTYILEVIPKSNWGKSCSSNTITVNANTGGNTYTNNNFYLKPLTSITDVNIYLFEGAQRPGFTGTNYIYYQNNGTVNTSGTITYTFSNDWSFVSSTPMPDSYNPTTRTLTWSYNNLPALSSNSIKINMSVASNISLGTLLNANCSITTTDTDINLVDNSSSVTASVVGSFDPNDIQVTPQGEGEEGYITTEEEMTYKIRFQNTGTDYAEKVSVTNELDANLVDYTLTVVKASHNYVLNIKDNMVTFDFPYIFLPDSNTNEPMSHGYIVYKINRKAGLASETKIYNQANIYFDYNTPVETNRVQNTIAIENGTSGQLSTENSLVYYPNPCSTQVNVKFNATTSSTLRVELYSTTGQNIVLVDNTEVSQGEQSILIDLTKKSISNGLYIMKTVVNDHVFSKQVFIQK